MMPRALLIALTLLHGLRLIGLRRVMAMLRGSLPPVNYVLGLGDMTAGALALCLAAALAAWGLRRWLRRALLAWNAFGAADLGFATVVELVTRPSDPAFYKPGAAFVFMLLNLGMFVAVWRLRVVGPDGALGDGVARTDPGTRR